MQDLFASGRSSKIGSSHRTPAILILDHIDAAIDLADLRNVRKFHALKEREAGRYSMWVSGNDRITFGWSCRRTI